MKLLKILIGLILLLISLAYLYRPDRMVKFNALARKYLFNDQLLLNHRRKIGVILLLLGFIAIFMGITQP